jgi:hypothetical protein
MNKHTDALAQSFNNPDLQAWFRLAIIVKTFNIFETGSLASHPEDRLKQKKGEHTRSFALRTGLLS